jgi:hypothetical protein
MFSKRISSATLVAAMAMGLATAPAGAATKMTELKGTWSGPLNQVARAKQFTLTLKLDGKTGTSTYPDAHCSGKLTRAGTVGDTVFYSETITEGKLDAATKAGCVDGNFTLIQSGTGLVAGWLGTYDGKPIVVYGVLAPAGN